tara:strand:+ start:290 stop:802 length:513 start_codon:yes stop_codon:yes gene_type:complete
MQQLQRITTEYIDTEDRFRLTGISDSGETMSFWLTQRLLIPLLKACIDWMEHHSPDVAKKTTDRQSRDSALSLAHQSAKQQLPEEKTVVANSNSPNLLVKEIDIKLGTEGIELIIKENGEGFALSLNANRLRQWMAIIYALWLNAKWPDSHWPEWIKNQDAGTVTSEFVH